MTLTLSTIRAHMAASLRNPRAAAGELIALNMPYVARRQLLVLVAVCSILLGQLGIRFSGGAGDDLLLRPFVDHPLAAAAVQLFILIVMVHAIHRIGAAMGGSGAFEDALLLVAWLQFMLVCVQGLQLVLLLIFPQLAALVGLAGFVLFFWLLTQFVCELHGFNSAGRVFAMIVVSTIGIIFALSLILALLGLALPGAAPNV